MEQSQQITPNIQPSEQPSGSRKWWIPLQIAIGAALSVFLGWLLVHGLDWGELGQNLLDFPLHLFVLALGAFLIGILFRAWRWHVLFVRERIGFFRLFLIQNAGIGLNNLSPVRVVSEPLQLALISRRGGVSASTGLATLATEHLMDVFATASLLGVSVIILPQLRGFSIQLGAAIVLATVSLGVFILIAKGMDSIPGVNRVPFLSRTISAIKDLGSSPLRLFLSFAATLAHWGLLGLSGWIIAQGLNIDVEVAAVVVLFMGSVFFVSAVPSLPGGAITIEAAVVYTLGLFGVEGEPALLFAVMMHIIMFVPSTLIAGFVLPREGIKMFGRKDRSLSIEQTDNQSS